MFIKRYLEKMTYFVCKRVVTTSKMITHSIGPCFFISLPSPKWLIFRCRRGAGGAILTGDDPFVERHDVVLLLDRPHPRLQGCPFFQWRFSFWMGSGMLTWSKWADKEHISSWFCRKWHVPMWEISPKAACVLAVLFLEQQSSHICVWTSWNS